MTYTLEDTKKLIEAQIAKKGEDYVYPKPNDMCYYFIGGQPSCVVGYVLADVGITISERDNDNTTKACLVNVIGDNFDRDSVELLNLVQWRQDMGRPWGDAYQDALVELDED
jgi:hypothetical protein